MNSSSIKLSISEYEQLILDNPHDPSNYWCLGLLLLLQGQEEEAQLTWMNAILEAPSDQVESYTQDLIDILKEEAEKQGKLGDITNLKSAWLIRQHIREINQEDIENLLHILLLCIDLKNFDSSDLIDITFTLKLLCKPENTNEEYGQINNDLLFSTWQKILDYEIPNQSTFEFILSCIDYVKDKNSAINILRIFANKFYLAFGRSDIALELTKICSEIDKDRLDVLTILSLFYQELGEFPKSIEIARDVSAHAALSDSVVDRVNPSYALLRGLTMSGGNWYEALEVLLRHEKILTEVAEVAETQNITVDRGDTFDLLSSLFLFPYFRDDGQKNRQITNLSSNICQSFIRKYSNSWFVYCQDRLEARKLLETGSLLKSSKKIKIGYVCSCFRQHSVGWLARSLFQYHDRNVFEVYIYFAVYKQASDPLQDWYKNQADHVYKTERYDPDATFLLAKKISDDGIDILVELDSITSASTCELVSIKPAPIQITWLGWDASGIPAIDYFIADPYVLPSNADDYYSEKIWRLPHTFVAIDGFEVGVPTLSRENLDIPKDAIVYFSGQVGQKRHPDTIRLQIKIIKKVPNSYLLIKGGGDKDALRNIFYQIALEEGVSIDKLRFLVPDPSESLHRANLSIADIVLDTYPYNGATTTLETLWMCIPLVTRVGNQFSSRNSYTMMMNAGISEGIAWTDAEYVDWGIHLGKDELLRQQVTQKLRQSRQTSPLWNGEQFTREMENAYKQMWEIYVESVL